MSLPWIEKYRPETLDEVISHPKIVSTIQRMIDTHCLPHLLFYGPPGTGKTSTILACARKMFGEHYRVCTLELNASDERGIDTVRKRIKGFASTKSAVYTQQTDQNNDVYGYKLIILDEADAMTFSAQAALRKVIETYSYNVRFCLICNYLSKIIPALQSRCTRFRFGPLLAEQINDRLQYICTQESLVLHNGAIEALLQLTEGDMRKCLNILQSVAAYKKGAALEADDFFVCTGQVPPADLWLCLRQFMPGSKRHTARDVLHMAKQMEDLCTRRGAALADILVQLHRLLFDHVVGANLLPTSGDDADVIRFWKDRFQWLCMELGKRQHCLSSGGKESIQTLALATALMNIAQKKVA